jgi:hypothetical protein
MKFIRRVHLYSGIFMFPWVLMYGVTGWLFNHPRLFTADTVTHFDGEEVLGGALSRLVSPEQMARSIVDEINFSSFLADGPEVKLTDKRPPQLDSFLSYTVKADGMSHSITLDPISGDGEIRSTRTGTPTSAGDHGSGAESASTNPLQVVARIPLPPNNLSQAQETLPWVLEELRLPNGEITTGRRTPTLSFSADIDGVPSVVTCNLSNGNVAAMRDDVRHPVEVKNFAQRLHLSRGYSPHFNTRWFWALSVDAMFLSMVFWGLSGLLMWWQIKRTRWPGAAFLVVSLAATILLVVGMHDSFAVGGIRSPEPARPTVATNGQASGSTASPASARSPSAAN